MGRHSEVIITLDAEAAAYLEHQRKKLTHPTWRARRYEIVALRAQGESIMEIHRRTKVGRRHIYGILTRYLAGGFPALESHKSRGRAHA